MYIYIYTYLGHNYGCSPKVFCFFRCPAASCRRLTGMLRARLYSADRVHFDVDSEAIARYQAMKWAMCHWWH